MRQRPKIIIKQRRSITSSTFKVRRFAVWFPILVSLLSVGVLGIIFKSPLARWILYSNLTRKNVLSVDDTAIVISIGILLLIAILVYWLIDYREHRRLTIKNNSNTTYSHLRHFRAVALPRFKYKFKSVGGWILAAEGSLAVFLLAVVYIGFPGSFAFTGSGQGAKDDPYIITNCQQLQEITNDLDAHYQLANDIDCSDTQHWNGGRGFIAVAPNNDNAFSGVLDGKNYAITNLHQYLTHTYEPASMIGHANGATIKNIELRDVNIEATVAISGGVSSFAIRTGRSRISNVKISGQLKGVSESEIIGSPSGDPWVSGLSSLSFFDHISNIDLDVDLDFTGNVNGRVGSLGGMSIQNMFSSISNVSVRGTIDATILDGISHSGVVVGGIVGSNANSIIKNSYTDVAINVSQQDNSAIDNNIQVGGAVALSTVSEFSRIENIVVNKMPVVSVAGQLGSMSGTGGLYGLWYFGIFTYKKNAYSQEVVPLGGNNYINTSNSSLGCFGAEFHSQPLITQAQFVPPGDEYCKTINAVGGQANYFKNNSSNPPFDKWDFGYSWQTNSNNLPSVKNIQNNDASLPSVPRSVGQKSYGSQIGGEVYLPYSDKLYIEWLEPMANNPSVNEYIVEYKLISENQWTRVNRSQPVSEYQMISDLNPGTGYDIRVAAVNSQGQGDWGYLWDITTNPAPSIPSNFNVTGELATNLSGDWDSLGASSNVYFPKLDWDAPPSANAITGYRVRILIKNNTNNTSEWVNLVDVLPANSTSFAFDKDTHIYMNGVGQTSIESVFFYNFNDSYDLSYTVSAISSDGEGMPTEPQSFKIYLGLSECQQMHDLLSANPDFPLRYQLTNNIDCSDTINWNNGDGWIPVGGINSVNHKKFKGIIEGNNFTISNVYISDRVNGCSGLISWAVGASVKNLILSNIDVNSLRANGVSSLGTYHTFAGGLIGCAGTDDIAYQDTNVELSNISISGSVDALDNAAGIVGSVILKDDNLSWNHLHYSGQVKGKSAAGIVANTSYGDNNATEVLTLEDSSSAGQIISWENAAGIASFAQNTHLKNVSSTMNIISGCYVGGASDITTGGLIGMAVGDGSIEDSEYSGSISCGKPTNHFIQNIVDVAVDNTGYTYILGKSKAEQTASNGAGLVYKVSPTGQLIDTWIIKSFFMDISAPVKHAVWSIDTDNQGYIYVYGSSGMHKLDNQGTQLDLIAVNVNYYNFGGRIAVDGLGQNVYIADKSGVIKYDLSTGSQVASWDNGGGINQSNRTVDVDIRSNGDVVALSSFYNVDDRVDILTSTLGFKSSITATLNSGGSHALRSMAVDSTDHIYILDLWSGEVNVITNANNLLYSFNSGSVFNQTLDSAFYQMNDYTITAYPDGTLGIFGTNTFRITNTAQIIQRWQFNTVTEDDASRDQIAGGLIGGIQSDTYTVTNSSSSGQISTSDSGIARSVLFGGLVGLSNAKGVLPGNGHITQAPANGLQINNSSSELDIDISEIPQVIAGGLVASSNSVNITSSNSSGNIIITWSDIGVVPAEDLNTFDQGKTVVAGGLVGFGGVASSVDNSLSASSISLVDQRDFVDNLSIYSFGNEFSLMGGGVIGSSRGFVDIKQTNTAGSVEIYQGPEVDCALSDSHMACDMTIATGGLVGMSRSDSSLVGYGNFHGDFSISESHSAINTDISIESSAIGHSSDLEDVSVNTVFSGGLTGHLIGGYEIDGSPAGMAEEDKTAIAINRSSASGNIDTSYLNSDVFAVVGGVSGLIGSGPTAKTNVADSWANVDIFNHAPRHYPTYNSVSGTGGAIGSVHLEGSATVQRVYASGDISGNAMYSGGLIGSFAQPYQTPPDQSPEYIIADSYSTSNIAINVVNPDISCPLLSPTVGGVLGVAMSNLAIINNVYASGELSLNSAECEIELEDQQSELIVNAIRPTIGGLIGGDYYTGAILSMDVDSTSRLAVRNSFSAAIIHDTENIVSGGLVGYGGLEGFAGWSEVSTSPVYHFANVYYDRNKSGNLPCANSLSADTDQELGEVVSIEINNFTPAGCIEVNVDGASPSHFKNSTTTPPLNQWDFTSPIWHRHVNIYPTFSPGELPPGPPRNLYGQPTVSSMLLSWDPPEYNGGSPIIDYILQYRIHGTNEWIDYVHSPSIITSYVVGGLDPGARYDFQVSAINAVGQSEWVLGVYDVLIPGGQDNEDPDDSNNSEEPNNSTNPSIPTTPTMPTTPGTGVPARPVNRLTSTRLTTPIPSSEEVQTEEQDNLTPIAMSPSLSDLSPVENTPRQNPKLSVVPYFFISWLWVLATYYIYRAFKERQYVLGIQKITDRIAYTEKAVSEFLNITTHYLRTPLTIIGSAIELIASKHSLDASFIAGLEIKVKELKVTIDKLTNSNTSKLDSVQTASVISQDYIDRRKYLWIPVAITGVLVIIADIILTLLDAYRQSWGQAINHGIWFVLGLIVMLVTFAMWSKQKQLKLTVSKQKSDQQTLLLQKQAFVEEASMLLGEHAKDISIATDGLEQFNDTKIITNGVSMLNKVANALNKVHRFSNMKSNVPVLNLQDSYARDVEGQLKVKVQDKAIKLTSNINSNLATRMQPDELKQLFESITNNAVQFSKEGGSITVLGQGSDKRPVITVKDTGLGMSTDTLSHIFEPMTRGSDTETFNHDGLGMNMYINRMILKKYGGDITVASQIEQGTLVTVRMPEAGSRSVGAEGLIIYGENS